MPRKTSQIVTDLRDIATGHDLDGQMVLGNILREAADRLEAASTFDVQTFASRKRLFFILFDPAYWLKTLRACISDGSIDDLVKK